MSDKFDYTYSAPTESERKEAEAYKREYMPERKQLSVIEKMRALDKKVKLPAEILAAVLGVIGTLMLGVGMCLSMDVFYLTVNLLPLGVVIGILGIAVVISDYFIYKAYLSYRKKKYADEILALTEKFLNGKEN